MDRPKVGVAVAVCRDDRVLLGLRKRAPGAGMWALPGGHLEGGETFEECGIREIKEETGILLSNICLWTVENVIYRKDARHFVVVYMRSDLFDSQKAKVIEPTECERLGWFLWSKLPTPLMLSTQRLVDRGMSPFDTSEPTIKIGHDSYYERSPIIKPPVSDIRGRYVGIEPRFKNRTAHIVVDGMVVRAQFDAGELWETHSRLSFHLDDWEIDINGTWRPLVVK